MLLVEHGKALYWGFPKGHTEPGESLQQTATRELKEETNLDIIRLLSKQPLTCHYSFLHQNITIEKTVHYFPALVSGNLIPQIAEIGNAKWILLKEAPQIITYDLDRRLLDEASVYL